MANLKCVDVQALTVPLKHRLSNTLNFWLSQFVCEGAQQNGEWRMEHYLCNSLYLLICVINHHLSETGGEDALDVLKKADISQVKC